METTQAFNGNVPDLPLGHLQAERAQTWVNIGSFAQRPVILPLTLPDRQVIDAGKSALHQSLIVELPQLIAVAAIPVTGIVAPLIGESHGHPMVTETPEFLDQAIVQLPGPLTFQEGLDRLPSPWKLRAITPDRILGIGLNDPSRTRVFQRPSAMRTFSRAAPSEKGGINVLLCMVSVLLCFGSAQCRQACLLRTIIDNMERSVYYGVMDKLLNPTPNEPGQAIRA